MNFIKRGTPFTFQAGPFLDDSDGKTIMSAFVVSAADVFVSKNGAAFASTANASVSAEHDRAGFYPVAMATADTDTAGTLKVEIQKTSCLPVWETFQVLTTANYDGLFGTGDLLSNIFITEPTGVPAWNSATVANAIALMLAKHINPTRQNETTQSLYTYGNSAVIASAQVSTNSSSVVRDAFTN